MKKIIIISHKLRHDQKPIFCQNGDAYDSLIQVRDQTGKILWEGICNVDSSNNLNYKIEITDGDYKGIVGLHKSKYKGILIYDSDRDVKDWHLLTDKERTLLTMQPNPKHGNTYIARYVNIHKGGDDWDWSEGCITIYWKDWANFISKFEDNEIMQIIKYKDYQEYQGALHI